MVCIGVCACRHLEVKRHLFQHAVHVDRSLRFIVERGVQNAPVITARNNKRHVFGDE